MNCTRWIAMFFCTPSKMVSYRDMQHLSNGDSTRKSRKGRGTRKNKSFRKGSMSRTHPGRKDFTTKRGNKYYDRGGHRYRYAQGSMFARIPYTVKSLFGLKSSKGGKRHGRK
jgi:hypothetical protein